MTDDILQRLADLDDTRLRAVVDRLSDTQLQNLVLQAAAAGDEQGLATAHRVVGLRDAETDRPDVEVVADDPPTSDATLLSWNQFEALIGNDTILGVLHQAFDILAPWQRDLADSAIDAFGIDLIGAKNLVESLLPINGIDFKAIHEQNLADGDIKVEFEPQGLNFIWFTRGPYVRRRPFVYLVTGGQVSIGGGLAEDIPYTISPYVAHYTGSDDEVTPDSWTEWFADAGIGRDNSNFGGKNVSLSYFESADGPADVIGIVNQRLRGLATGDSPSPHAPSSWKGFSIDFSEGKGGPTRTAGWLGSLFYR